MGLFDDMTKGPVPLLIGLGVAMVGPSVIPAMAAGLRPFAKALVKGGLTLYDAVKEGAAEAGEQLNDLAAETRAEMASETHNGRTAKPETNGGEQEYISAASRSRRRRPHA